MSYGIRTYRLPKRNTAAEPVDSVVQNPEKPAAEPAETVGVQIELASEEFLSTFSVIHEFDYTPVGKSLWGIWDGENADRLVIWTDVPLKDFAVISLSNDFIEDELFFIPIDTFGMISELTPGTAFIINSYMSQGTLPWSGITFMDESGSQRYFLLVQDQSDEFPPYRLIEFKDRTDELPPEWEPWW